MGYLLVSPLRRFRNDPEKLTAPYVKKGMTVLDAGCAMGYYSIPLAEMVGKNGKVICVDLQKQMIDALVKRAKKHGLLERIETRVCTGDSLQVTDLAGQVDFALASAVVHEVPDRAGFFQEICRCLRRGGRLLVTEPALHVKERHFLESCAIAERNGFLMESRVKAGGNSTALFRKNTNPVI